MNTLAPWQKYAYQCLNFPLEKERRVLAWLLAAVPTNAKQMVGLVSLSTYGEMPG